MTLFDVLGGMGIAIGLELIIALFLWIKYLVCITRDCDWSENWEETDDCICETPDSSCCRVSTPYAVPQPPKKGKTQKRK